MIFMYALPPINMAYFGCMEILFYHIDDSPSAFFQKVQKTALICFTH